MFDKLGIGGSGFAAQFAQGAIGSAVTQGIGVATRLQDKFDWAGVAAAGLAQGVGSWVGGKLPDSFGRTVSLAISSTAGAIASAASRSVIEGSSFGDNLMAALPDAIGQTIGLRLAESVQTAATRRTRDSGNGAAAPVSERRWPRPAPATALPRSRLPARAAASRGR